MGAWMQRSPETRRLGWLALASGAIGLLAVAFLIAALAAPTPDPTRMRRETDFFRWQDAGVILQALTMLPVTLGLYRHAEHRGANPSVGVLRLGLVAQGLLALSSALIFPHVTSDMLYMGPIGLVGLWLLLMSRRPEGRLSTGVVWTGRIAGFGLLLVGIGLVIYGALVAPAVFVRPLTPAEIDLQTLTPANLVAHICMALGTLLGRLVYPLWALLLGAALLRRGGAMPA